jgi:hypothetical protein
MASYGLIPTMSPQKALLYGGLVMGAADILEIIVFFAARGVPIRRILQTVASGLMGRAAFTGGTPTAALGLLLHFLIAFTVVGVYQVASRRLPELGERPFLWGPVYGFVVYVTMNNIVLPLSAAPSWPKPAITYVNAILVHMFVIGLLSALFARAAQGHSTSSRRVATAP